MLIKNNVIVQNSSVFTKKKVSNKLKSSPMTDFLILEMRVKVDKSDNIYFTDVSILYNYLKWLGKTLENITSTFVQSLNK